MWFSKEINFSSCIIIHWEKLALKPKQKTSYLGILVVKEEKLFCRFSDQQILGGVNEVLGSIIPFCLALASDSWSQGISGDWYLVNV